MKTIIYTRGHNVNEQINKCKEYASLNGYKIIGAVNNDDDMIKHILDGSIDAIIVSTMSRVARSQEQYLFAEHMLRGYGVRLISAE